MLCNTACSSQMLLIPRKKPVTALPFEPTYHYLEKTRLEEDLDTVSSENSLLLIVRDKGTVLLLMT